MATRTNVPSALALFGLLAGCTLDATPTNKPPPKPSTDFLTEEIYPSTSVSDDGSSLTVVAALIAGGNFLALGSGDRLVARIDGRPEMVLVAQGQTNEPHYAATFASTFAATDVVLTLDRNFGDDPFLTLHVPAPFSLDGPPPSTVKSNVGINVVIAPAPQSDDGVWAAFLEGTCVPPGTSARINLLGGALNLVFADAIATDGPASCPATVKLQHVYYATVPPTFVKPLPEDARGVRELRFPVTATR